MIVNKRAFSREASKWVLCLPLALSLCNTAMPALALSPSELVSAIDKAKILSSGTRVNASINGAEAIVSTYKNSKANDNDCKIEAVLIAKTAMDISPEIARVTVYFYSVVARNKYKVVAVTAGDVKAFGSGQLGQEQLLSSIALKDEMVSDPGAKVSNYFQQNETLRSRKNYDAKMNGTTLEIMTDLDTSSTDRDVKYEALQIAEKALESAKGAAVVKVTFADPVALGSYKQVSLDAGQIKALDASLQQALYKVEIAATTAKIDIQSLTASEGPLKEERDGILTKLKNLDKQGVGVGPFVTQYLEIARSLNTASDDQLIEAVGRLDKALTEQEARTKGAKAPRPSTGATTPTASAPPLAPNRNRWSDHQAVLDREEVLQDPSAFLTKRYGIFGGQAKAEANKDFLSSLSFMYTALMDAKRTSEANTYAGMYQQVKRKNGW